MIRAQIRRGRSGAWAYEVRDDQRPVGLSILAAGVGPTWPDMLRAAGRAVWIQREHAAAIAAAAVGAGNGTRIDHTGGHS